MVVYAVREPHPFQIFLEGEEIFSLSVALIVGVQFFENATNLEVVATVLVEEDISSPQCCLL